MWSVLSDPLILSLLIGAITFLVYLIASRPRVSAKGGKLPQKMKRLLVLECPQSYEGLEDLKKFKVAVEKVDVPSPQSGEVLVKMCAAPVNPSDIGSLRQAALGNLSLPRVFGKEGCGVVVASGGGVMANRLIGSKVGVVIKEGGTWQEYVCLPGRPPNVNPLDQSLPVETGASFFVNPLTAVGLFDVAKRKGSPAFIHSVGNSQLGQMMVKVARSQGCTIVNMVRKEEGRKVLEALGAEYVVVTSHPDWQHKLKSFIKKLNISVAFDAIAGDMTGTLMGLLPEESTTVVYGGLAGPTMGNIPIVDMIYGSKKVEAFFLTTWLTQGGMLRTFLRLRSSFALTMSSMGPGGWAESLFEDTSLEEMWPKMCRSTSREKKLRIRMDL